jgi:hypothetical protein
MRGELIVAHRCLIFALLAMGGCAIESPQTRIADQAPLFNSWSPSVQTAVRAGQVKVGFTADQVRMALGMPDFRITDAKTNENKEVWVYRDRGPFIDVTGASEPGSQAQMSHEYVEPDNVSTYRGPVGHVTFVNGRVTEIETELHLDK